MMIPGVWATGQFDAAKKFLSSQYQTTIPVYVQIGTTVLHWFMCSYFIATQGMHEDGAAICTNITYLLNLLLTDLWIRFKKDSDFTNMVFFYDKRCTMELGSYLRIGIPGMLMLCFEWWAFELLALFTGLLGVD